MTENTSDFDPGLEYFLLRKVVEELNDQLDKLSNKIYDLTVILAVNTDVIRKNFPYPTEPIEDPQDQVRVD